MLYYNLEDRADVEALFYEIDNSGLSEKSRSLLRETLMDMIDALSERERSVILLRFGFVEPQKECSEHYRYFKGEFGICYSQPLYEVALQLNVKRERIRQIERKALRKMRTPPYIRQIINSFDS